MKDTKFSIFNFQLSIIVVALVLASCSSKKSDGPASTITLEGVTLKYIPAGSFTMGSPESEPERINNETQHKVNLSGFYLSEYTITNAQYCAFLNASSITSNGVMNIGSSTYTIIAPHSWGCTYTDGRWQPVSGYGIHPVIMTRWYGADEYCKWAGGRLPTEAEWEYACRAGTTGPFNTGPTLTTEQANYDGASSTTYNPAGTFLGYTVPVTKHLDSKKRLWLGSNAR